MTTSIPINYKKAWTNTYIFVGVFCVFIFLFGFFIIGDYMNLVYSSASIVPIYIGFEMKKVPYAVVSKTRIEVFGFFGELKYEYLCDNDSKFTRKNNKIYIQSEDELKKIKMNKWFVNQKDWNRALALFK